MDVQRASAARAAEVAANDQEAVSGGFGPSRSWSRNGTARIGGCQNPSSLVASPPCPEKEVAMGRLDGRTAWVTGGGRGIGRAIALAMAREGAVVAVSSRTRDELESVTREIEGAGSRGLVVTADALDLDQTNAAARAILDSFGRLDILVNNAGGVVVGIGWLRRPPADRSRRSALPRQPEPQSGVGVPRHQRGAGAYARSPARAHHQHRVGLRRSAAAVGSPTPRRSTG